MARGGARPGAGRKAGSLNKRTQDIAEALSEGLSPLEFLTNVYRDVQEDMARRVDAAKAAAPYVHPRRAPVGSDGEDASLTVIVNKP